MRRLVGFSALVLTLPVALWSSSREAHTQSSPSYGVTDLGTLGGATSSATGIMNSGFPAVAGFADTSSGVQHAFSGNTYALQDAGTLGGARSAFMATSPFGRNTVGWSDTASGAFHAMAYGSPMRDLGTLGGTNSSATAANDNQLAVGYSDIAGDGARHAFVYDLQAGTMSDLGASLGGTNSSASAINANNHVAGFADLAGDQTHRAFLFENGTTTDLGSFGSWSETYAMNDSDVVVGAAGTANGQHAFVYSGSLHIMAAPTGTPMSISKRPPILAAATTSAGSPRPNGSSTP